jgi:FKBP-type peptidyl-prolyl cis-trans isomerases 1
MNSKFILIGLGVVVLIALVLVGRNLENTSSVNEQASISTVFQNMQTNPSGLQWKDVTIGEGSEVVTGSTVSVHYTGTLTNGTKFDSSYDRGTPFTFTIGEGQVIAGWEEGLLGMRVGGKRELVIPPTLAYGDRDLGVIPPHSTLQFVVEVVGTQ